MSVNRGKAFEDRFRSDWQQCFPGTFLYRLPDQLSMYKGSSNNPCDFVAFNNRFLYILEIKSGDGASFSFSDIPQYERLLKYKDIKYVVCGVILWLKEKDKVLFFPIKEMEKIYKTGEKSIGLRHIGKYDVLEIPSTKLKVFMKSDYSILVDWAKEQYDK